MAQQILKPFLLDETGQELAKKVEALGTTHTSDTELIVAALQDIVTQLTAMNETLKAKDGGDATA